MHIYKTSTYGIVEDFHWTKNLPSPVTIYRYTQKYSVNYFFADAIMVVISSMQLTCAKKFMGLPILAGGEIGANFLLAKT